MPTIAEVVNTIDSSASASLHQISWGGDYRTYDQFVQWQYATIQQLVMFALSQITTQPDLNSDFKLTRRLELSRSTIEALFPVLFQAAGYRGLPGISEEAQTRTRVLFDASGTTPPVLQKSWQQLKDRYPTRSQLWSRQASNLLGRLIQSVLSHWSD